MSDVMNEIMLQVGEVARLLKVHPVTISRWIRNGKVPGVMKVPGPRGNYRIPLSVVEKLYEENANDRN